MLFKDQIKILFWQHLPVLYIITIVLSMLSVSAITYGFTDSLWPALIPSIQLMLWFLIKYPSVSDKRIDCLGRINKKPIANHY